MHRFPQALLIQADELTINREVNKPSRRRSFPRIGPKNNLEWFYYRNSIIIQYAKLGIPEVSGRSNISPNVEDNNFEALIMRDLL